MRWNKDDRYSPLSVTRAHCPATASPRFQVIITPKSAPRAHCVHMGTTGGRLGRCIFCRRAIGTVWPPLPSAPALGRVPVFAPHTGARAHRRRCPRWQCPACCPFLVSTGPARAPLPPHRCPACCPRIGAPRAAPVGAPAGQCCPRWPSAPPPLPPSVLRGQSSVPRCPRCPATAAQCPATAPAHCPRAASAPPLPPHRCPAASTDTPHRCPVGVSVPPLASAGPVPRTAAQCPATAPAGHRWPTAPALPARAQCWPSAGPDATLPPLPCWPAGAVCQCGVSDGSGGESAGRLFPSFNQNAHRLARRCCGVVVLPIGVGIQPIVGDVAQCQRCGIGRVRHCHRI